MLREGIAAMGRGDLGNAEYKFREVLRAEPDATQASMYLYALLYEQGRIAAADQVIETGLLNAPESLPLAKFYARSLLNRDDAAAALTRLENYRPAGSGDSEYLALMAALMQKASRYEHAEQIYRHLLTLDQRAGDWWVGLGIAQDGLGKRAEALQAFERARGTRRISAVLADYTDQRIAELQAYD
jgi:MSHA biogenesis protein MshN